MKEKERWQLRRAKMLKRNDVIWDPFSRRKIYITEVVIGSAYVGHLTENIVSYSGFSNNVNFAGAKVAAESYLIVRSSVVLSAPPAMPTPPPIRYEKQPDSVWQTLKDWLNGR